MVGNNTGVEESKGIHHEKCLEIIPRLSSFLTTTWVLPHHGI